MGMAQHTAHARVEQIITEVIFELERDPTRKFTFVEMKFLNMWYIRQTKERQESLKKLVKEGRFEIIMGGWVHTDESNEHFEDIIENFVQGHQWLSKEFGIIPRIGWNIDAFGHTQANAALFHDLGFEALFFARAGLDDIQARFKAENHQSHFLWRPLSKHFGNQKEILGALIALSETYGYPKGFKCDEHFDDDGPIQNDKTLQDFNGELRIVQMVNYIN
jgi:lysosomal alpha-mannosidase